jgi:SAM-dependent methyltransferase
MFDLASSAWRKMLGHPFVYDQIRPRVVGGIDMRPVYERLPSEARRLVLDVGCGTGDALRYLDDFEAYLGIDTDPIAIAHARKRWASRPNVRFEARLLEPEDVVRLEPTGVVLSGVLHHLTNDEAVSVFRLVGASPRLVRIVTNDIVFLPGRLFNNVLAMMDRGRYCRHPDAYAELARRAGLRVEEAGTITSSPTNDRVRYFVMSLGRKSLEPAQSPP